MEPILFAIILIPPAIALMAKFVLHWNISWIELAVQIAAGAAILAMVWFLGRGFVGSDKEVWNGVVTSKAPHTFQCPTNTTNPCRNGYDCNCYQVCTPTTDSKGNVTGQSCTTYCDTCYRYPWERDWHVESTLGRFTIARVDAQGAQQPPRYGQTRIGEGVSQTRRFENIVAASANTLFRDSASIAERYTDILPEYPLAIFDYWRIDRVITPNVRLANERLWNTELSRALGEIGPQTKINAIFVFVDAERNYAPALRYHWSGFKQNDAVIVIGVRGGVIGWAEVMSWSKNPAFDIELRGALEDYAGQPLTALNPSVVVGQFQDVAKRQFQRRSMEEFEYLRADIPTPKWLIVLSMLLAVAIGTGTSVLFHRFDLDEELHNLRNPRRGRYGYRY